MNALKLRIAGMHCESCEKLLKKALSKLGHIKEIDLRYNNEIATIYYNQEINVDKVISIIRESGYDAMPISGDYSINNASIKQFLKDLKNKNKAEGQLIFIALQVFAILALLEGVAYFGFFRNIPNFFNTYGYFIIFLLINVVLMATSVWHIKIYGNKFTCMTGMMIGMTIGMLSGFLIGIIVGATNGMFVGSVAGLLIGMAVGGWCGKCCGIMGIMEGIMAGLMGGLMGAMTSLMLLNDNLKLIFPIVTGASALILGGLDYMIYKETKKNEINETYKYDKFNFISFCFLITIIVTFIMVYGTKSLLFR
ncbi:cation transporter [Candidatus Woesearchaeota archaeon]|nr:cation transporter [Candidatus Woesearchaeota archaeon]